MAEVIDFEKFRKNKIGDEKPKKVPLEKEKPKPELPVLEPRKEAVSSDRNTENLRLALILRRIYPEKGVFTGRIKQMLHATHDFNPNALKDSRALVEEYSTNELMKWFTEKEAEDWLKKPAFFHAIAQEVDARIMGAIAHLDENKK